MIYDRQRSLWKRESDAKLANEVTSGKYKFYRWVRRVGDYKLEVCLDRPHRQPSLVNVEKVDFVAHPLGLPYLDLYILSSACLHTEVEE